MIAEYDALAVTKALPIHAGADGEDYNSKLPAETGATRTVIR